MSKTEHKLSNGQSMWVQTITGKVLEQSKISHTEIRQGRATVGHNFVVPGRIYSETHTTQEVWLQDDAGGEHLVNLEQLDLAVRGGHTVTAAWAGLSGKDSGQCFSARNHTTGKERYRIFNALGNDDFPELNVDIGLGKVIRNWAFGGAIAAALIGPLLTPGRVTIIVFFLLAAICAIGGSISGVIIGWVVGIFSVQNTAKRLAAKINKIVHDRLMAG